MKILSTKTALPIAVFIMMANLLACEPNRTVETSTTSSDEVASTETDTIRVVQQGPNAAQELKKFKDWVNRQAGKVDSSTNKNLPEVQAEFKKRTAQLEKGLDSLSAEAKAEYKAAREKYKAWEEQNKQRTSQPLQAAEIKKRQAQLLGEYKNLNTITAANVREAYLIFMGVVRAKKHNWNQNDWDYVDYIYRQLNNRKGEFETAISTTDKLKIRSLQAEYLALEASQDAKDLIKTVKSK